MAIDQEKIEEAARAFEVAERDHCSAAIELADLLVTLAARPGNVPTEIRGEISEYKARRTERETAERAFIEAHAE